MYKQYEEYKNALKGWRPKIGNWEYSSFVSDLTDKKNQPTYWENFFEEKVSPLDAIEGGKREVDSQQDDYLKGLFYIVAESGNLFALQALMQACKKKGVPAPRGMFDGAWLRTLVKGAMLAVAAKAQKIESKKTVQLLVNHFKGPEWVNFLKNTLGVEVNEAVEKINVEERTERFGQFAAMVPKKKSGEKNLTTQFQNNIENIITTAEAQLLKLDTELKQKNPILLKQSSENEKKQAEKAANTALGEYNGEKNPRQKEEKYKVFVEKKKAALDRTNQIENAETAKEQAKEQAKTILTQANLALQKTLNEAQKQTKKTPYTDTKAVSVSYAFSNRASLQKSDLDGQIKDLNPITNKSLETTLTGLRDGIIKAEAGTLQIQTHRADTWFEQQSKKLTAKWGAGRREDIKQPGQKHSKKVAPGVPVIYERTNKLLAKLPKNKDDQPCDPKLLGELKKIISEIEKLREETIKKLDNRTQLLNETIKTRETTRPFTGFLSNKPDQEFQTRLRRINNSIGDLGNTTNALKANITAYDDALESVNTTLNEINKPKDDSKLEKK